MICFIFLTALVPLSLSFGADELEAILRRGVATGVYPGAVAMAGRGTQVLFAGKVGHYTYPREENENANPMEIDTLFDVASLSVYFYLFLGDFSRYIFLRYFHPIHQ